MITALLAGLVGYFLPHSSAKTNQQLLFKNEDGAVVAPSESTAPKTTVAAPTVSLPRVERTPTAICDSAQTQDPRKRADASIQEMAQSYSELCRADGGDSVWCDDLQSLYYRHHEIASYLDEVAEGLRKKCDDEHDVRSCAPAGLFASMTENTELSKRMFRIGCMTADSARACDELRRLGYLGEIVPSDMFAIAVRGCRNASEAVLQHRSYCEKIVGQDYSDELFDSLYDERDEWGEMIFPHPEVTEDM